MPTITINGREIEFEKGKVILQVALDNGIEIPHYCYHDGLSIVANCRICLAEVWAPNPRNDDKLEPIPKLLPTCQTPAGDGQVVYTNSPKSILNQKAVMEYLLINHPVDCPVCDQAGECHLQDYSYQFGRGQARFAEQKIKQPKKDVGPHVLLYSDRCIMCTRCVRFTREVTGTNELIVVGRGATEQIDVFPGIALDNELSANVIDICPVGALLDKDFLFQQRVWFLHKTPSIDGITCSGDNISVEHNNGQVYRLKPRTNLDVNKWWITDEVRYGWKFVHDENRLRLPALRGEDPYDMIEAPVAYDAAYEKAVEGFSQARGIAALLSPMLSCEDAYLLAKMILEHEPDTMLAVGPVPHDGQDKTFPGGFTMYAEKAPNARGVKRVLAGFGKVLDFESFLEQIGNFNTLLITGNYPSDWVTPDLVSACTGKFTVVIDTLPTKLAASADVLIPGATWIEKAGTFENVNNRLQAFERAIDPIDYGKSEAQIALDLMARKVGETPRVYNAKSVHQEMAETHGMGEFLTDIHYPTGGEAVESDMEVVEL
ncbi:MAG: (2Fe-2S)-binding protein [Planctomycetes bacterium]|nr:(2Fe-2S)-binding protein [Planctomycetota bacterium]MCH7601670.1 (2Fe-2S)-binding protein [Planctomycetota bacterium]